MPSKKLPKRVERASVLAEFDITVRREQMINDLKVYTWENGRECALLTLRGGKSVVVAGGVRGIAFEVRYAAGLNPFGEREAYPVVRVDGQPIRVDRLICHTHPPPPTGPSDADFTMLDLLQQEESVIYEIGGEPKGTMFRRRVNKQRNRGDG
ncbi:MAG TPA: hypothetical protein VK324_14970 [Tepidisphaeraceae bacterium]|nr:hypothetical protein [Tepidisphaeraceae bacterium]